MLDDYPDSFALVQIHIGDPYNTPWGNERDSFYSVGGTPTAWFDGVLEAIGTYTSVPDQYAWYRDLYTTRRNRPTDVTIDVTGDQVVDETFQIQANVCIEAGGVGKAMRVHIVQVLDDWPSSPTYSRNGFKQAAEDEVIVLAPGECQPVQRCFTFDRDSWQHNTDMRIIVWAQETNPAAPAEVHQAAVMDWPFPTLDLPGCCLPSGDCVSTPYDDCVAQGGDPLGPGSTCCEGECHPLKWSQPPTINPDSPEPDCFWGWDESSAYDCDLPGCQIVADDYACTAERPISDVHWWGSYLGWASQDPPLLSDPEAPDYFHIGIWTDVPAGVDPPYSHPGEMIREWTVARADLNERNVGCDFHPDFPGPDTCFRYDFAIPQEEWFLQESADPTIYWVSIAAHYATGEPTIPWGWKTREHFYNDPAVRITDPNDPTVPGSVYVEGNPIEHPEGVPWDMAFTLGTFCPAVSPPAFEDEPVVIPKNRYISFVPGNPGQETALRVTLLDSPDFPAAEGYQWWVGSVRDISEASNTGGPEPPPVFKAANLQCTPLCWDWSTVGLLSVVDDDIVPGATYEVQAINCWCDPSSESSYSEPLTIATSNWGDVVGNNFNSVLPGRWDPPQGVVDFNDISSLVDKFKNVPEASRKVRMDVAGNLPDAVIDFVDISWVVEAFRSEPYPFAGPQECP